MARRQWKGKKRDKREDVGWKEEEVNKAAEKFAGWKEESRWIVVKNEKRKVTQRIIVKQKGKGAVTCFMLGGKRRREIKTLRRKEKLPALPAERAGIE